MIVCKSGPQFVFPCRVKDYIGTGLSKDIIDPDDGRNVEKKRQLLLSQNATHVNIVETVPKPPDDDGWDSSLADLPSVSFATLYKHFVERKVRAVLELDDSEAGNDEDERSSSFRTISKGYTFFADGHVQKIMLHRLPSVPDLMYVRADVLPSMIKNKVYKVHVCLTQSTAEVKSAFCVCTSGLEGSCNHIAGLLYALENFVRLGLREDARLSCTSKLQQWNKPRKQKVPPARVQDVQLVKEEYGKVKRKRRAPRYDPRAAADVLTNPQEVDNLRSALKKENERLLSKDDSQSGMYKLYGTSCWLRLLAEDSSAESKSEASSCNEHESGSSDDEGDVVHPVPDNTTRYKTKDEYYKSEVVLSDDARTKLQESTVGQSSSQTWFVERRKRVTSTMAKAIARRRKSDFTQAITQRQLCQSFRGNAATRYGMRHESDALEAFKQHASEFGEVKTTGLVVDKARSWLAASPDGILTLNSGEDILVEVKCPYRARDCTVPEALTKFPDFFVIADTNGSLKLKETHEYYFQVQVAMHVCRCMDAYLVVWTKKDISYVHVSLDQGFVDEVLAKLEDYYFKHLLPALFAEH